MATEIRPELAKRNPYWLPKHRYYELQHFCRQYWDWRRALDCIDSVAKIPQDAQDRVQQSGYSDPTFTAAEAREYYLERLTMVIDATTLASTELADCLLEAVTEGLTYDKLKTRTDVPCGRQKFYEAYRRFFWYLSKLRG